MADEMKLAVVTTHPIQYQVPLWRALAAAPGLSVTVFYASVSGAARYHDVDFGRDLRWDIPLLDGYSWQVLPNRPLKGINWRLAYRCPSVHRELARGRFDAALLVGKEFWYYLQAIRASHRLGIPLLLRAETPPGKEGKTATRAADWFRSRTFRRFSRILCVGESQADFYRGYGVPEENLGTAPYCVDNKFFRASHRRLEPQRGELRAAHGFTDSTRVIAFAGKFTPKKRPLDLVRAFERLPSGREYGLLMAGSGPLQEACTSYVTGRKIRNVAFAGFKNQTEIGEIYTAADCFALPSDHGETWGLVVNEAMNFSLPIVVSDRVGCGQDLVREGQNGFRSPCGNVDALAEALVRVFEDEKTRRDMGRRSLEIVGDYCIQSCVRGIQEAMEAVARPGDLK